MRRQSVAIQDDSVRDWSIGDANSSNDNTPGGGANSPQAVFGEMLRIATMIVGVAFAFAFAMNAIHLG